MYSSTVSAALVAISKPYHAAAYNLGMSTTKTMLTAQEFDEFPFEEDKRYELDEGEMIEMTRPAYKHNRVLRELMHHLELYLRKNPIGEPLISENLYALSDSTRRAPDIAILLGNHESELRDAKVIHIIPDIAAEVLSPNESPRMIHRKLRQYFDSGVKEVWLIDPESSEVEIWTGHAAFRELTGQDILSNPLLPGFGLPLTELFLLK